MIPPNGFNNPDRVVKTYSFGLGEELIISQEQGDYADCWSAMLRKPSGQILYLTTFGQWSPSITLSCLKNNEKELIALLKKA